MPRVVGVVEAYREDGEFDGTRNYAIYRKPLDALTPRTQNRPPRNTADQGARRDAGGASRSG